MEEKIIPNHIAIIMDGNRRWAVEKGMDKIDGHKYGAQALENTVKVCLEKGIKYITVYAFSTENWNRSEKEVSTLMFLLQKLAEKYIAANLKEVKIKVIGDVENVPGPVKNVIKKLEDMTKDNQGIQLNIAFNYGGRLEIVRAAKLIAEEVKEGKLAVEDINDEVFENHLFTAGIPDPDLVIRTSGELRTSNFLPWQITYSEFLFLDKYWPDFGEEDIDNAIEVYANRNRRKGK